MILPMLPNKFVIKLIATAVVVSLIIIGYYYIDFLKNENAILNNNNAVLQSSIVHYKTSLDYEVATTQGLILSNKELKNSNKVLYNKLKELDVKYSDASAIITSQNSVIKQLKARLKDSTIIIIQPDGTSVIVDTLKCFEYTDKYSKVDGCINKDSIDIKLNINVPVDIVLENIYKHKFLWFKWGVLTQKLYITSDNKDIKFTDIKLYIPK